MHLSSKLRNKPSLGRIIVFRTFGICFRTLHALVWSVHGESVHVHGCTTSFFHSAWFGRKNIFAATLERANARQLFAAQKPGVRGYEVIMRVCGEICDDRADRIYDSDDLPLAN